MAPPGAPLVPWGPGLQHPSATLYPCPCTLHPGPCTLPALHLTGPAAPTPCSSSFPPWLCIYLAYLALTSVYLLLLLLLLPLSPAPSSAPGHHYGWPLHPNCWPFFGQGQCHIRSPCSCSYSCSCFRTITQFTISYHCFDANLGTFAFQPSH